MVGILLVSHGEIAEAFLDVANQIVGDTDGVQAICLPDPLDENKVLETIQKSRKHVDHGKGILILTDMFGGTPANLCFSLMEDPQIEVLTGMNLPMIIKILSSRKEASLPELARIAMDCGRENIYLAREILEQKTKKDRGVQVD